MLSPITLRQFAKLQARYPNATLEPLASGAGLLTLPEFPLPAGWTSASTTVRFLVPNGYPGPSPDCFWASSGLRLANGGMPQNTADPNPIPDTPHQDLWFSWHVVDGALNWNPNRDDLLTYVSIINGRFAQLQ